MKCYEIAFKPAISRCLKMLFPFFLLTDSLSSGGGFLSMLCIAPGLRTTRVSESKNSQPLGVRPVALLQLFLHLLLINCPTDHFVLKNNLSKLS